MKAKDSTSGLEIDAQYDLAFRGDLVHITVHARGGSVAANSQTNPGYEVLIQSLLERLQAGDGVLEDVLLASKTVANVPPAERRIKLREFALPLKLAEIADVTTVRLAIRREVVTSHSRSKIATHGNATKRIELIASSQLSAAEMGALLECGDLDLLYEATTFDQQTSTIYLEGSRVLRTHLRLERNRSLVKAAKLAFAKKHKRLFCEACGFDFAKVYGELGVDFIEAHHESPLGPLIFDSAWLSEDGVDERS